MPPVSRTINQSVNLILSQVSEQTRIPINMGLVPMNLFFQGQYVTQARDENACDALAGVFEDENGRRSARGLPPIHVAWGMLFDPTERAYYFNVAIVEAPRPPSILLGSPRIDK
jgi:hypothetical protein